MKLKQCIGCGDEKQIWKNHEGNKYCQYCWNKIKFQKDPPKVKPRQPIKPKSKKQAASDRAYTLIRTPFMLNNPMCQATLPGCQGPSSDVHHKKGRGKYHLMTGTWMAVCRACHQHIHEHPIQARELGFLD
jgi:hypothetical protein